MCNCQVMFGPAQSIWIERDRADWPRALTRLLDFGGQKKKEKGTRKRTENGLEKK